MLARLLKTQPQTADRLGRRPQTADRRPQTADRRPQTADRRPQTADRRRFILLNFLSPLIVGIMAMIAFAPIPMSAQGWSFLNVGEPLGNPLNHRRELFEGVVGIGPFAPNPGFEPVTLLHVHSTKPGNVSETPFFKAFLRLQTQNQNVEGDNKYLFGETGIEFFSGSIINGGATWCVGKILGVTSGQGVISTGDAIFRPAVPASAIDLRGGLAFYCSPSSQNSLPNETNQIEVMRIVDSKVGIGTIYPQAQLHATKLIMTGETGFSTYDATRRLMLSFMPGSNSIQYHMDNRNGIFHISSGPAPGGTTINGSGSGDEDIMDILGWNKAVSIGATFSGGGYTRTYPSSTACSYGASVGGAKLTVSDEPLILYTNATPPVPYLDVRPIVLRLERRNVFSGDNLTTPYKLISAGHGSAESFIVQSDGKVNIGKSYIGTGHTDYLLSVSGKIVCNDLRVVPLSGNWPDYVFSSNHILMPLEEVEKSVKSNKHLPGMPSAKEIEQNGIDVGEMQKKLLEKIEELTLYIIDMKKENTELRTKFEILDLSISKNREMK